jgi:hypothetical protein
MPSLVDEEKRASMVDDDAAELQYLMQCPIEC